MAIVLLRSVTLPLLLTQVSTVSLPDCLVRRSSVRQATFLWNSWRLKLFPRGTYLHVVC